MSEFSILLASFLLCLFLFFLWKGKAFVVGFLDSYSNKVDQQLKEIEKLKDDATATLLKYQEDYDTILSNNESDLLDRKKVIESELHDYKIEVQKLVVDRVENAINKMKSEKDSSVANLEKEVLEKAKEAVFISIQKFKSSKGEYNLPELDVDKIIDSVNKKNVH